MKLISGPGESMRPHKPSCQNSTVTPNAAPMDSRNPVAATSGTISERNTMSSSTSARPTTSPR